MHTQTLVVGAGVVGLAVTQRLARGGREVLCLEARERPAQVTSARNSGVLHAALYYPTGSLKARLCLAGNAALGRFCAAHDVPLKRVGKLIVATAPEEEVHLERLLAQARANGVTGVSQLDGAQVRRLEPHVHATAGLLSEATGILDVHALCEALERAGKDAGATLALQHRVLGGERVDGRWRVRVATPDGATTTVDADEVVLAGGLHADTLAAAFGLDVDALGLRQHWVKGRYCRVQGGRPVSRLVYPVPAPQLAGLGVHLTLELDGGLKLGPDVVAQPDRVEDYSVPDEVVSAFHAGAVRYLPWLKVEQLSPDQAGLRPKLSRVGEPFRDFAIAGEAEHGQPGLVALAGLESPGLTACLPLAEEVAARVGA